MKYFIIENSTDEREIGDYPQVMGLPRTKTVAWFEQHNSMTNLSNEEIPSYTPDLQFELNKSATLTDVIHTSNVKAKGLLMSPRTKEVFENFNLGKHKFHKATIIQGRARFEFFFLQPIYRSLNDLNFSKSSFFISNVFRDKIKNVEIQSGKDLLRAQNNLELGSLISGEKLELHDEAERFDLFCFPLIHHGLYVSENLLNKIQSEKISGLEIINSFTFSDAK